MTKSRVGRTAIRGHGVTELQYSILRNGFLPLDRIVVRPISGSNGKYVVVEGTRRLAALRFLRQQIVRVSCRGRITGRIPESLS